MRHKAGSLVQVGKIVLAFGSFVCVLIRRRIIVYGCDSINVRCSKQIIKLKYWVVNLAGGSTDEFG